MAGNAAAADPPPNPPSAALEVIAMAIASYERSSPHCFYEPALGEVLAGWDAFYERSLGSVWEYFRAQATDTVGVTASTEGILYWHDFGAGTALEDADPCESFGRLIARSLMWEVTEADVGAVVLSEFARLEASGGRLRTPFE